MNVMLVGWLGQVPQPQLASLHWLGHLPSLAHSHGLIGSYTVYPRTPDQITDQEINGRLLLYKIKS